MNIDLLEKEEVVNNSGQPQTEIPKIWIWRKTNGGKTPPDDLTMIGVMEFLMVI